MPSTFLGLNTSYRGLVASNSGLNTTANNISNIETAGYSRQKVNQVASSAIRTYTSYGCVGTGVDTLAAERVRDVFYDIKYWNNNSKLGEYDKKQYYAAIVESYLNDTKGTNAVKGFTSIFDEYEAAMESLGTNTGDSSYALDFIGKAGNLCEYFNLLYNNFKSMQTDVNDEIKIKVDEINGIAQEIATLNKEINTIEMDGVSVANELRDKRDLLVDELSAIVDVSVEEKDIIDAKTGEASGVTAFSVKIAGGQTLVDCYDYRQLQCVPRDTYQQVNANDAEGLYDVSWTDTGDDLGVHAKSTQGELKGLFEMRDGNNGEAFNGRVSKVDPDNQTVSVKVTDSYLLDMCKSTLPLTNGKITLSGKEYYYKEWSFQLSEDGKSATYTFQLDEEKNTLNNAEPISTSLTHEKAKIGEQVNYQGIPYYMEQMNEWVRNYAESFNKLYGVKGATDYRGDDHTGAIFYTGSGQISLAEEMYDNGELGFFPVPDTEGMDNMSTNVPIHAGFAEGFNKATYDDTMQEFFDYMCENFSDACYTQAHVFSPFKEDSLPEGLPQLYYDTQPMFENAETAWTSWDDKLDSDVLTKIVDEQQKLAQGITTPDEFIETCDSFVK